jgi:hypothetical protein
MIGPSFTTATRRLLTLVLCSALAVTALNWGAPPAHAATSSVSGVSGVIYDTCSYHRFRYAIDPAKAAYDWSLEVRAIDPRGVEVSSSWLWKDEGDPPSGTTSGDDGLQICSSEIPGTWRLEAELNFYGGPYTDEALPTTSFTMRKARSRASLSVNDSSARYGQRLRFASRVTGEFPTGYFALSWETVRLQKRTASGWQTIARTTTNENGVARFAITWKERRRKAIRVVANPGTPYVGSVSRTLLIS